jgi:hypothetical protein
VKRIAGDGCASDSGVLAGADRHRRACKDMHVHTAMKHSRTNEKEYSEGGVSDSRVFAGADRHGRACEHASVYNSETQNFCTRHE